MLEEKIAQFKEEIQSADNQEELENLRIQILGRNGFFSQQFQTLSQLPEKKRRTRGKKLNQAKEKLTQLLEEKKTTVAQPTREKKTPEKVYRLLKFGHLHPITLTSREINRFFHTRGFSLYNGPEIETDEYCFRRLNVPPDHPARDMQDTIFIKEPEYLLRTQASAIETHLLEKEEPPFKAAFPGRVYRNEAVNKSNHFIFHHFQGVAVNESLSLKDLIGTLNGLFKRLYGGEAVVRYRCKYYPEVEPGLGLDLQCFNCQGQGCSLCKGAGWIEMGGAGIIHPKVMKMADLDPQQWRGFAFGLGLDRWVMAKYDITDIRTLLGGNLAYKPNLI